MRESGGFISVDGFCEAGVILEGFFDVVRNGAFEVYNEFSFQHELGIYLREKFSEKKVQFERNAKHFGINEPDLIKKEIDIAVFRDYVGECRSLEGTPSVYSGYDPEGTRGARGWRLHHRG